eukprot:8203513-Alexandrium_andersonii.AAC.1
MVAKEAPPAPGPAGNTSAAAASSGGTDAPLEEVLELRPKRRRERDDAEGDRRSAEADGGEDERMRDADEAACPHGPMDEEMEVPDAGCGDRVATLRVGQAH